MTKSTEADSKYTHLEQMSVKELLTNINKEDKIVPYAIEKVMDKIELVVLAAGPVLAVDWEL